MSLAGLELQRLAQHWHWPPRGETPRRKWRRNLAQVPRQNPHSTAEGAELHSLSFRRQERCPLADQLLLLASWLQTEPLRSVPQEPVQGKGRRPLAQTVLALDWRSQELPPRAGSFPTVSKGVGAISPFPLSIARERGIELIFSFQGLPHTFKSRSLS